MSRAHPRFSRQNPQLPPAVANLWEIAVRGMVENQETINTFFYADGGQALTPGIEAAAIAAWVAAFQANYLACISSDFNLTAYKMQCLTTPSRIPVVVNESAAGTAAAGHLPSNVGVTILRQSGIKGQAGRGRITLPACPVAFANADSLLTVGALVAINPFAGDVHTAFVVGAVTYTPQIVSRHNKLGPPLGASPCLSSSISDVLGTCRRRKIGRGK